MIQLYRPFCAIVFVLAFAGFAFGQELVTVTRQDQQTVALGVYETDKVSCRGVAIISPGAGGSEKGYSYLAEGMSAQGYLAIVVGHKESGREAVRQQLRGNGLREGLSQLITDPAAYEGRFMDIAAAKKWSRERCNSPASILLGHSMGAATAMIEAGAKNNLGLTGLNTFDLYVTLSPQGVGPIFSVNAWQAISKPVLIITGTRDNELGGGSWKTRLDPFNNMPPGCKWLGVIDSATHMNFAGHGISRRTELLTVQTIQAFLLSQQQTGCRPPMRERGIEIQTK